MERRDVVTCPGGLERLTPGGSVRVVRLIPGLKRALAPKEITLELLFLQPNQ